MFVQLYRIHLNRRSRTLVTVISCLALFAAVFLGAWLYGENGEITNLQLRKLPPSWEQPFGTDWLGRDMFARTLKGLRISLMIGLSAATASAIIALILGLAAATLGKAVDTAVTWLIDVAIATPHLILLILIAFACGGGAKGVIIAVAASHWPVLTRIIRAEVLQLRSSAFIHLSAKLGRGPLWIAWHHMLPHLLPQFVIGLLLMFPHAILHAAALTFLGFGMSPHTPAIGVLLAESMRYLSMGLWWLAVAPGLTLIISVQAFDILGNSLRVLLDPKTCRE
ncbi:MAG: ABC transporter permease [Proteobacteria bacterium]|nr:ABC transporter permease [Pseudomonadota bacterium]MBU1234414.1 ABC transporter permease [Pseudomonadota bacterium]MBU1418638.1 ABC transporter permease [Pseudomonadota bacterium]MBU1455831.1 ABC transporter permease [Pseudomonadota bacterium]